MTTGELEIQIIELMLIALAVASISWTITHEELLREPRQFCERCSREAPRLIQRKLFYVFTCEYCLSHWISLLFVAITHFRLIYTDWRGYLLSLFALVWIANQYMSIFGRLRLDIKRERVEIKGVEQEVKKEAESEEMDTKAA